MQTRFLLGPAGSGKTFRCLAEVRAELASDPEGPPLILLAPKQATFQLERQLLGGPELRGYTRLEILSFDRLARYILQELAIVVPELLGDEGRLMVLRALLSRRQGDLKLFRATARLPGFAAQLSRVLREFQCHQLGPEALLKLAARAGGPPQLGDKIQDLALLLRSYLDWLDAHGLEDGDCLLDLAARELRAHAAQSKPGLRLGALWLDGFAEMTPQELDLLAALVPHCDQATLAFCLEGTPVDDRSWLSCWSVVSQTFRNCHQRLASLSGVEVTEEVLKRHAHGRFAGNPVATHLERHWAHPVPFPEKSLIVPTRKGKAVLQMDLFDLPPPEPPEPDEPVGRHLRVVVCAHPEAEAVEAAREILRFVQAGGRYREAAVLVRQLDEHHATLRRVFLRYGIPFFLDRREPVGHHLLAELTRSALRVIAFNWRHHDWFGALKTGLVSERESEIDWLENQALARGWEGKAWASGLKPTENPEFDAQVEALRRALTAPFLRLQAALGGEHGPTGARLAEALRGFWDTLDIGRQLETWSAEEAREATPAMPASVHLTVWDQMQEWLANLERAFAQEVMPLREWLPVLEAGLGSLTVGVIPPALDQVLIGAVDRSRNPDLHLTLLLGMNETLFPAPPAPAQLLTDSDRDALENHQVFLGLNLRQRLAHERFYGYIATTRARTRLVLTCARAGAGGKALNPSPFIAHLQRLFPKLVVESAPAPGPWLEAVHPDELLAPLLQSRLQGDPALAALAGLPVFASRLAALQHLPTAASVDQLSPLLAGQLYGPELRTSVSRLEKFAECPFRFFVDSGLRAEERVKFEFDARQLGSFQHLALERFHLRLRAENRRWHDLTPGEARQRMAQIVEELTPEFSSGLMVANDQNRFSARSLGEALQNFIEAIVSWMPQCDFEPEAVEVTFKSKEGAPLPPWKLDLGGGHTLAFEGQIDRIDLWRSPDGRSAHVIVLDYKSSARALDQRLMANGVQLQLPAYLNVLHQLPEARALFRVEELIPAGVFYVSLRGKLSRGDHRDEVLAATGEKRRESYQHTGRFDLAVLNRLDNRNVDKGDQFKYALKKDRTLNARSVEALAGAGLQDLIERVEHLLVVMGRRIYAGEVAVDPYSHKAKTPCERCDFRPVCRIDSWEHSYRALKESEP